MKKLILICGLLASSFSFGVTNKEDAAWQKKQSDCIDGGEMGESIMRTRQSGTSIRDIYKALSTVDQESRGLISKIVNDAYDVPQFESNTWREKAIRDFGDKIFKECMESEEAP